MESGRVPEKGRIRASIGKGQNPGECRKSGNPGEYLKGGIRASTGEGSGIVLGKGRIRVSARNVESGQVPKRVESGRVSESWNLG